MGSPLKQKPKKSTVSAHGQLDDAEREYQDDLAAHNKKKGKYWYKINGKPCTKAEYNAYKNKPGSDEPGKTTNDPDASGNKAKIANNRANNKASKRPTVLTKEQTKLKNQGTKTPEKNPPFNYDKTPLDFSSPLKGKKRRARRALREEKYGTKSRRKARKITGNTRKQQKFQERIDKSKKSDGVNINTSNKQYATEYLGLSPVKQTVNVPKHPDLKLKKTKNTKISQGNKKSKNPKTSQSDHKKLNTLSYGLDPGVEKAVNYIKKKITPR